MFETGQRGAERATYTVKEAALVLGVHYLTLYTMIREQKLPVLRAGRRILISRCGLHKMIECVAVAGLPDTDDGVA